jgi:hypothetical protein
MDFKEYQRLVQLGLEAEIDPTMLGVVNSVLNLQTQIGKISSDLQRTFLESEGQMTPETAKKVGVAQSRIIVTIVVLSQQLGLDFEDVALYIPKKWKGTTDEG